MWLALEFFFFFEWAFVFFFVLEEKKNLFFWFDFCKTWLFFYPKRKRFCKKIFNKKKTCNKRGKVGTVTDQLKLMFFWFLNFPHFPKRDFYAQIFRFRILRQCQRLFSDKAHFKSQKISSIIQTHSDFWLKHGTKKLESIFTDFWIGFFKQR